MNPIVHFEIPVDQVERAQVFYQNLFGWKMNSIPNMGYTLIQTTDSDEKGPKEPGRINGGMLKRQGCLTAPILTIQVEDIDGLLPEIEKQGGEIAMPKIKVGDMGFSAYFKDSEGNVVGLWQTVKQQN